MWPWPWLFPLKVGQYFRLAFAFQFVLSGYFLQFCCRFAIQPYCFWRFLVEFMSELNNLAWQQLTVSCFAIHTAQFLSHLSCSYMYVVFLFSLLEWTLKFFRLQITMSIYHMMCFCFSSAEWTMEIFWLQIRYTMSITWCRRGCSGIHIFYKSR